MKGSATHVVARGSLSRCGGSSSHVATGRWALFICAGLIVASCMRPGVSDDSRDRFGIITSEGTVLAIVQGSAIGFTNADLTRLIWSGVAEAYPIQCEVPSELAAAGRQIFWNVINDGRKPTAVISVRVVQDGKIVRSAFNHVAAPGSSPDAVFMYDVSHLARRVLPPAARPLASPPNGCP